MDTLMKLVLAALEWSYEAKAADVQEKWLEQAAELHVLLSSTSTSTKRCSKGMAAGSAATNSVKATSSNCCKKCAHAGAKALVDDLRADLHAQIAGKLC